MQVVPIVPLIFSFQSCDDIMIRGDERLFMGRIFCAARQRERPHPHGKHQSTNFTKIELSRQSHPAIANSAMARNAPEKLPSFTRVSRAIFSDPGASC